MNALQPFLANGLAEFINGSDRPNHLSKIYFEFLAILQPIALFDAQSCQYWWSCFTDNPTFIRTK